MVRTRFVVAFATLVLSPLVGADTVLVDTFDDRVIDPAWTIEFIDASGWDAAETGGQLVVSDIDADVQDVGQGGEWGRVRLTRSIEAVGDLTMAATISWNSADSVHAMQQMSVSLLSEAGLRVASVWYDDAWFDHQGGYYASVADGSSVSSGSNSLPHAGIVDVGIERVGDSVAVTWGGATILEGALDDPVTAVRIEFSFYDYDGPGADSFFGTETVDVITVVGTPVIESSPADFNEDGVVDAADLATLLAAWGACADCPEDLNADGVVGPADLAMLLAEWG